MRKKWLTYFVKIVRVESVEEMPEGVEGVFGDAPGGFDGVEKKKRVKAARISAAGRKKLSSGLSGLRHGEK